MKKALDTMVYRDVAGLRIGKFYEPLTSGIYVKVNDPSPAFKEETMAFDYEKLDKCLIN